MHIYFQQVVLTAGFPGYVLQLAEFLAGGVDVDDGRLVFVLAEHQHQFFGINGFIFMLTFLSDQ